MNVQACDNCKKLNTEVPLLFLTEKRASPGDGQAKATDPLTSFRLGISSIDFEALDGALLGGEISRRQFAKTKALCKPCAQKEIAGLMENF